METFYIGATPIGGDSDITRITLDIIADADYLLCENIETTKKLINYGNWKTKDDVQFIEYCIDFGRGTDIKNHGTVIPGVHDEILKLVQDNKKIIYLPERGSVGIEDPGFELIEFLEQNNIKVRSLPGPSSIIAAIIAARPMQTKTSHRGFIFQPLVDLDKNKMEKFIKVHSKLPHTAIFMTHDDEMYDALCYMKKYYGPVRKVTIGMNLGTPGERIVRTTLGKVIDPFNEEIFFNMYTLIIIDAVNIDLP